MQSTIRHKSIVIGCDDMMTLSLILQNLENRDDRKNPFAGYAINTASRSSDLITAIKTNQPGLVILGFRKNQEILNDIQFFTQSASRIIFCFTSQYESNGIRWDSAQQIFTYPLNMAESEKSIGKRVRSVLALLEEKENKQQKSGVGTFGSGNYSLSKNLSRYVMELDQKKAMLDRVKRRIKDVFPHARDEVRRELQSVVNMIKASDPSENYWEDFKTYFENVNPDFIDFLTEKHPGLTPKDLKYCCYLKMNMSNNDITQLLGINQESVRTHKYRLKKKLALSRNEQLESYLKSFDPSMGKTAS